MLLSEIEAMARRASSGVVPPVDLADLSRRTVAAYPQWQRPGMLVVPADNPASRAYRITAVDSDGRMCGVEDGCVSFPQTWGLDGMDGFDGMDPAEWAPVLSDPATIGCLLALVREKWAMSCYLAPAPIDKYTLGWVLCSTGLRLPVNPRCQGATEAEALVAALEVQNG